MNKNQLVNFITFSILESKRVEDRLSREDIKSYLIKLNKRQLKAIKSEFILKKLLKRHFICVSFACSLFSVFYIIS